MKLLHKLLFLPLLLIALSSQAQQKQSDFSLNSVVIDPGHGGKDPGTISPDRKTRESDLTLKISKLLAEKIRTGYPEMQVGLTREKDVYVDLIDRAKIATKQNANLFISVHINAARKNSSANGFSVYILGQSADKSKDSYAFNMEVVARENSVIYLEDDYSSKYAEDNSPEAQILMQFMYNAFREQSLRFAESVDGFMLDGPFRKSGGVHQANFCVLRQASMPAVLLELGFMSNTEDLKVLRRADSAEILAENIYKAFCKYKTEYDRSVSTDAEKPSEQVSAPAEKKTETQQPVKTETAQEPAVKPVEKAEQPKENQVRYGIQVLASSKLMDATDKTFKGYMCEIFKVGTLYKYVLVPSADKSAVARSYVDISSAFPGCFGVKIENGDLIRCNFK